MGDEVRAKPGEWLWLDGAADYFLLESGAAELYVVYERQSGGSVRRFLEPVDAGDFLCGVEFERIRLLVIAVSEIVLRRVSWEQICGDEQRLDELLAKFFQRPEVKLLPRTSHALKFGAAENLAAGTFVTVSKEERLGWLSVPREKLEEVARDRFFSSHEIILLASTEYVCLAEDAEVELLPTKIAVEKFGAELVREALRAEVARFCEIFAEYFLREEKLDEERLAHFAETKELLRFNSYSELLKHVVPDLPFVQRAEDKYQPPVVHAIREIGDFYGIPRERIRLSSEANQLTDLREILRLISVSSGLYSRAVELDPDWYRQDLGALLLFREGKPFAALPVTPSKYEYIDLEQGRRIPITAAEAESFETQAYSFAQKMPEHIDSLWKWFAWISRLTWRQDWWVLLLCCFIAGFVPVITPLVTKTVFADIIPSYDKQAHLMVVQVMFVTSVAGALTQLVRGITVLRIKNHARRTAESALWLKLLSLPANFFRKYQIGDLALRMQGINSLSQQLSSAAASGIFSGLFCFWNLLVMFYFSYKLAMLAVFIWAVYFGVSLFFSWRRVKFQREKSEASGKVSGKVLQLLNGLNKFKLRFAEERAFYLWSRSFAQEWKWNRLARQQSNWLELISQAQPLVTNFCIFYLAMVLFDESLASGVEFMDSASFLSFNAAMGSFGSSLSSFQSGAVSIWSAMPALERIRPILETKSEVNEEKLPAGELSGNIEVSDVNFRYNENSPLVLKNISFSVKPGEFLAIVGSSGSGKSTLLRVLLGLERPETGSILFDGQDVRRTDITSIRRQIGVVMQHGQLMAGSIFSNIVGSLPLTMEDAWEVARLVGLEKDIQEMPMKMHTPINEGGTTFSGGQRQRILIARSIVNHPRIVVFDEATSALDNETQAIVSQTLEKMRATRIIVAHRLSTIRNADRIIVLKRGEIVEQGTYDELIARDGIFTELARRQIL